MLITSSLDEVKKRETALDTINSIITKDGRDSLHDLTGLSGGFLATQDDLNLLETYIGPAIFEEKLQELGKIHLGGEKVFAVNRTSSGILASILALVSKNSYVIHFLPEFPAHPSIVRSCKLVGANYLEFDDINNFNIPDNTSMVIITGSTMDHKVIDEKVFKKIIAMAKTKNDIPILVDDASGARLRTAIFSQKKATELGADLVVTSTDKLMLGPRGGLMAGKKNFIDKIKSKATQFGLEAQPPSILAMVKGLEAYKKDDLLKSISKKQKLIDLLHDFEMFEETPTGIMVSEISLKKEIDKYNSTNDFSSKDLSFLWAMVLLKEEHIVTIPAVSMPGASATIRFDLASKDTMKLDVLQEKIVNSFKKLLELISDSDKSRNLLFGKNQLKI
ncbi:L-seryl-tRNA(Sec) selenium transferase [Methanobrevibacter cuticularis]|uniref:L-seryl-tRNA(Sec) selenium transferase n=1 Tax=Methanobrevibacter cuticularis TaxID=47311 RepID=A0A166FL22_9EURY|nr:TIGR03576 family pyridoxal phosphate-dependent enzyme [Methanobrevibacter cuticularis]KZX17785.1 L-seryl-tRNA(Sec) selenium transferase [Methanobrevibacter cuticularis]